MHKIHKMKKIIIGILAMLGLTGPLYAHIITVSNNTVNVGQYSNLQTAVTAAHPGDTIYVLGSPTDYGAVTITTPRITLIGAGYNVSGLQNNYNSVVDYVYLNGIVNSVKIQGLYINNSIQQSGTAVIVDSVDVERCYVTSGLYVYGPYWTIRNNNINNVYIQNNSNVYIQNNFLEDIENTNQTTVYVDHNDFATYNGNALYTSISNAQISNNVFYYENPENGTGCTFTNNITSAGSTINLNSYAGNTGTGNIFSTPPGWVDATIPNSTVSLSAVLNYTWKFTNASLAHNAASDKGDIGIYGGSYPMPNVSGIAQIPEITSINIQPNTVKGGNLNIAFNAQGKMAHGVVSGEYFFDSDPGAGNGTPLSFTPMDSVTINQSISIGALSAAFHVIGIRVKDSVGHWSMYQCSRFVIVGNSPVSSVVKITGAEYFFDKDPGQGNGTVLAITAGDSINVNTSISVGVLTGYHKLFIRTQDSAKNWSLYEGRDIYIQPSATIPAPAMIIAAEYFFDVDPGQGKGTPMNAFAATDSISTAQAISVASLSAGYHKMFIRTENSAGQWSLYEGRDFYVQPSVTIPAPAMITAAEYFFDKDPGQGNGTPMTAFAATDSISASQAISVASLSAGYHKMFIRTENLAGQWSLYEGRDFYVQPSITIPAPARITAAEYFFDKDPGQGMGTSIAVTKSDSINFTGGLALSSLTQGFHSVFIRTVDSLGKWSLYQGGRFYVSPAIMPIPPSARIVAAEYFFDKDPGQGKGTTITGISPADSINVSQGFNVSALSIGAHAAFVRTEDSTGHWSLYQGAAFKVEVCKDTVTAAVTKDSCFGGSDGTATAFPSGGSPFISGSNPYIYSWNTTPVQTTKTATGLPAGAYTITVTDSVGCPATAAVIVGQPPQIKIKPTVTNTTCGLSNGKILLSVSGGTGTSYKYSWANGATTDSLSGLLPGTYSVSVYDKYSCSSNAIITVNATSFPSITVTSVIPSQCGKHIGAVTVSTTGGTIPYRYSWNNGDTLSTGDSLTSGNYIITVTDKSGCSTYVSAAITNTNGPVITAQAMSEVKCYGQSNGAININVTGGVSPYTYLWSTGTTTQNVTGLPYGPYYVTVNDASGCSGVQTFTISQPKAPVSLTTSTTNSGCSTPTGTAKVIPTGGTAPYSYSWSSGETTDTAKGLFAGAYTVTVTDSNGCSASIQAAISSLNGPVVAVDSVIASICSKNSIGTGRIVITVTGGTGSDTYQWSDNSSSSTQNLTSVSAGTYNVQVTDAVGCVGTAAATIPEIAPPAISICMVTVDPASNHNKVIWNSSTTPRIASYNVYKETTAPGLFTLIGNVPIADSTVFVDVLSDPDVQSWRYEISQVDSCGEESPLSLPHKTMHLTISPGTNNNVNLIWDNYQGLSFPRYIVYRDSVAGVASDSIGYQINNGTYTYTAKAPPSTHNWYFHMGIDNPGGCNPSGRTEAINYNASKSNTGSVTFVGVNELAVDLNSLSVYPNPSTGLFTFSLDIVNKQNITLKVYNAIGQVMSVTNYGKISGHFSKEIDLSGLSKGVYILQVLGDNGVVYKKVVLQ
jgi:hypothetical protein